MSNYCNHCGETLEDEQDACDNCACDTPDEDTPMEADDVEAAEETEDPDVEADTEESPVAESPAAEVQPERAPAPEAAAFVAPAVTEEAPKKGIATGVKMAIAGIVAIVLLGGTVSALFFTGFFTNPVDSFRDIQNRSIFDPLVEAMIEAAEPEAFSTDIIFTASIESNDFMIAMLAGMLDQFAIELSLDLDDAEGMIGLGLTAFDDDFLSAIITYTEERFGLYVPTVGAHYSMDIEALFALLGNEFMDLWETQLGWTGTEDADLIREFADIILATVHASNLTSERESLALFEGRETVNATVYTFTPSQTDLHVMLEALLFAVRDNEAIFTMFAQQHQQSPWPTIGGNVSAQDAWDALFDEIDDEALAEAAEIMADGNFTWRTATVGRQLVLQEISFEVDGDRFAFRYEGHAGSGGRRTDWFTLEWADMWSAHNMLSFRNEMTTSRDTFDGTLRMYHRDGPQRLTANELFLDVTYQIDRNNESILGIPYGTFEIEVLEFGEALVQFSFVVSAGQGGGSNHLFTVYGLEEFGLTSVTVNMHSTDAPSTMERPALQAVDLSGMTLFQIEDILDDLLWDLELHFEAFIDRHLGALFAFGLF